MNGQKGMTMAELVVAIATTGIIVVFLGTAINQILTVSGYGNDRLTATHELENVAHWFNIDGQGAVAATGGTSLVLTMADNSSITYTLAGTEMRRTTGSQQMTLEEAVVTTGGTSLALTITDNSTITYTLTGKEIRRTTGSQQMTLARNITDANFSIDNRLVTMSLTASPPGQYGVSENGIYHVYLRPGESG